MVLLIIAVHVAIIALVIWAKHDPYRNVKTDLSRAEVKDAVAILKTEREKWSKLNSMAGHIAVELGTIKEWDKKTNRISFECDVALHQVGEGIDRVTPYLFHYSIVISNKQEGWSIFSDGSLDHIKLDCKSKELTPESHGLSLQNFVLIPRFFILPKVALLGAYRDELFPHAMPTLRSRLAVWSPWRNPNAQGIPHSYVFKPNDDSYLSELSFTDGYLSGHVMRDEQLGQPIRHVTSFVKTEPIQGLHFPTEVVMESCGFREVMRITGVAIGMKGR